LPIDGNTAYPTAVLKKSLLSWAFLNTLMVSEYSSAQAAAGRNSAHRNSTAENRRLDMAIPFFMLWGIDYEPGAGCLPQVSQCKKKTPRTSRALSGQTHKAPCP
jgi:hypothetical protein